MGPLGPKIDFIDLGILRIITNERLENFLLFTLLENLSRLIIIERQELEP